MYVGSRERPLGLFEVLARNRQGAVGLSSRTRSAQKQPNRVCTLPPREQLSSPRRLVVRKWRVIRIRIRIRIRIIAQVLKLPQPCKYNKRETRNTFYSFCEFFLSSLMKFCPKTPKKLQNNCRPKTRER